AQRCSRGYFALVRPGLSGTRGAGRASDDTVLAGCWDRNAASPSGETFVSLTYSRRRFGSAPSRASVPSPIAVFDRSRLGSVRIDARLAAAASSIVATFQRLSRSRFGSAASALRPL